MYLTNGKTCKHVNYIYGYSLHGNIDINYGNYILLYVHTKSGN